MLRGGNADNEQNRPTNHLVTDATQPFEFTFKQFEKLP